MERDKKFKKWENSIEGILYDLTSMCSGTHDDEQNDYLIAQVLQRLPKKAREKVLDEVIFVHISAYGTVARLIFQEHIKQKFFIIFNFKCIRKDETKINTIAHEIAHFILSPKEPCKNRLADIEEKEADDLAEKWGFGRSYKSYKRFKGAYSGI